MNTNDLVEKLLVLEIILIQILNSRALTTRRSGLLQLRFQRRPKAGVEMICITTYCTKNI